MLREILRPQRRLAALLISRIKVTAARALLEARRLADGPMRVSRLAPDAFEKVLVLSYQRDSAAGVMGGLRD